MKEEEADGLKRTVNELRADEGEGPIFNNVGSGHAGAIRSIRSDQFYGLTTVAEAAQQYLTIRKSAGLGSATVLQIYEEVKKGGFKFGTDNEEHAKNGLRISLRKNDETFHRLPNGDYGLVPWYKGVKPGNGDAPQPSRKKAKRDARKIKTGRTAGSSTQKPEPPKPEAATDIPDIEKHSQPTGAQTEDQAAQKPNKHLSDLETRVMAVVVDAKGAKVSSGEVEAAILKSGYQPTQKNFTVAVFQTLKRLAGAGEIKRTKYAGKVTFHAIA